MWNDGAPIFGPPRPVPGMFVTKAGQFGVGDPRKDRSSGRRTPSFGVSSGTGSVHLARRDRPRSVALSDDGTRAGGDLRVDGTQVNQKTLNTGVVLVDSRQPMLARALIRASPAPSIYPSRRRGLVHRPGHQSKMVCASQKWDGDCLANIDSAGRVDRPFSSGR